MPSLSHIIIHDNNYDWLKADYPKTVAKLEIRYCNRDDTPYAGENDTLSATWATLKSLPSLQYLHLRNVFPSSFQDYPDFDQTPFPSLKDIYLSGWARPIINLYSHMILPGDAHITLLLRYDSLADWIEEYPKLSQCVSPRLKRADRGGTSLYVVLISEMGVDGRSPHLSATAWKIYPRGVNPPGTKKSEQLSLEDRAVSELPFFDIFACILEDSEEITTTINFDVFFHQLASSIPLEELKYLEIMHLDFPLQVLQLTSLSCRLSLICLDSNVGLGAFLNIIMDKVTTRFPGLRSLEIIHHSLGEGIPHESDDVLAAGRAFAMTMSTSCIMGKGQ
ncbi:hypothetical protein C8Q75DRAFT_809822 [Abortiporus biennis]|nr:hypothetical protein C8Q75DRAFT_809822 [Abortiporus biennis]